MEKLAINQAHSDHILLLARNNKVNKAQELIRLANEAIIRSFRPAAIHFAIACIEVAIRSQEFESAQD